jgi:Phosphatidylinositol 3- and 4-kinase
VTPEEEALRLLSGGDVALVGRLPHSSNYTFLAEVRHPDSAVLGVYKPRRGERPLWDFPDGTLYRREVAAFELSRALGWPAVPPTVVRDGPHGTGSMQLFVECDPDEHFFTLRDTRIDDFATVALFDVIANNADRKGGHCLLASDGSIWVVDHGVCFATQPKLRTVIWEFAGEPIPDDLLEDVHRVAGELRSGALRDSMSSLLSRAEVGAAAARAEAIIETKRFPEPDSERPFPWPPV